MSDRQTVEVDRRDLEVGDRVTHQLFGDVLLLEESYSAAWDFEVSFTDENGIAIPVVDDDLTEVEDAE